MVFDVSDSIAGTCATQAAVVHYLIFVCTRYRGVCEILLQTFLTAY